MTFVNPHLTRRCILAGAIAAVQSTRAFTATPPRVTVHRDPGCGCCSGWVKHLEASGYATEVLDTRDLTAVKQRLGVPADLAACHTAEVAGYILEGHVPAAAIERLLSERPQANGLAVPGMPVGSPGMEGGTPEPYDVVLFAGDERRVYMHFVGDRPA
jgi:hypothetical protein